MSRSRREPQRQSRFQRRATLADVCAGPAPLQVPRAGDQICARQPPFDGVATSCRHRRHDSHREGIRYAARFPGRIPPTCSESITTTNEPFPLFDLTDFKTQQFDVQHGCAVLALVAVGSEDWRASTTSAPAPRSRCRSTVRPPTLRSVIFSAHAGRARMPIRTLRQWISAGPRSSSDNETGSTPSSLRLTTGSDPEKITTELRKQLPPDSIVATPAQRGSRWKRCWRVSAQALSHESRFAPRRHVLIYNDRGLRSSAATTRSVSCAR